MGEGWGDWYAKDFIVGQFPSARHRRRPGEIDMGDYIDLVAHAIRRQALDCPVTAPPRRVSRRLAAPARAASRTATSAGSTASPRSTATARSGPQTLWDLRRRSARPNARRADHAGHAAVAAGAVVPGHAQRDPAGRRGRGRALRDADLEGVRAPRHGLLRRPPTTPTTSTPIEDTSMPPAPAAPRGRIAGRVTDSATGQPVARRDGRRSAGWRTARTRSSWPRPAPTARYAIERRAGHEYPSVVVQGRRATTG